MAIEMARLKSIGVVRRAKLRGLAQRAAGDRIQFYSGGPMRLPTPRHFSVDPGQTARDHDGPTRRVHMAANMPSGVPEGMAPIFVHLLGKTTRRSLVAVRIMPPR